MTHQAKSVSIDPIYTNEDGTFSQIIRFGEKVYALLTHKNREDLEKIVDMTTQVMLLATTYGADHAIMATMLSGVPVQDSRFAMLLPCCSVLTVHDGNFVMVHHEDEGLRPFVYYKDYVLGDGQVIDAVNKIFPQINNDDFDINKVVYELLEEALDNPEEQDPEFVEMVNKGAEEANAINSKKKEG